MKADVTLHVQNTIAINFELGVGSSSESVTVQGVQFRWEVFNILNRTNFNTPYDNNQIFDESGNGYSSAGNWIPPPRRRDRCSIW